MKSSSHEPSVVTKEGFGNGICGNVFNGSNFAPSRFVTLG